MLEALREEVFQANLEIVRRGLVLYTFGNASGVSREHGLIVIKPSGLPYEKMSPADLVITDLDGRVVEGSLRPSSDLATHALLYRSFPTIGGVVHTHSRHATAWAQARREIPCFGTTHADYFSGAVPVTDALTDDEIARDYELATGEAILRTMRNRDPFGCPAVLVAGHAPFCWGKSPADAAHNAVVLEELAALALQTLTINPSASPIGDTLRDKHHFRKHGPNASYGQPMAAVKIYVRLLGEGSEAARPTTAILLENGSFKILATPDYDPEDEYWEFVPGEIVRCEKRASETGDYLLAVGK